LHVLAQLLTALIALLAPGIAGCREPETAMPTTPPPADGRWVKPDDATLRATLSPMQYRVTQQAGTEPPFANAFWDHHEPGLYVDVVTGEPLFASADKFDSGTGWPSFTKPVEGARVTTHTDDAYGMIRVEVRSAAGGSHLGHVFHDGPADRGGMRYCINSAALRFIPAGQLDAAGYGAYKAAVAGVEGAADHANACASPPEPPPAPAAGDAPGCKTTFETAILAGGCFWGMEDLLRDIPGVVETEVGYTGGTVPNPTYDIVHLGRSGHAEAVRVVFDPAQLRYADLLERWFFRMHDPTTANRQGNDIGTQYRSAIFATTPEQATIAAEVKAKVEASGFWKRPVVTEIAPAGAWTSAEAEHQDYLERFPDGYTCHFMRE
jgi:peptide methionine sulfoxide reductase msrA/msrB